MSTTLTKTHPAFTRWNTGRYGPHGLINSYWSTEMTKNIDLNQVVLCVEVIFGSDTSVRVSSKPCTTTSGMTGEIHRYSPVLTDPPEIAYTYSMGETAAQVKSLGFQFPNQLIDVAKIISQGRTLAGVVEVSFQVDGGDYDERLVVIRGDIADGITFGALQEQVTFSASDPKETIDLELPPYLMSEDAFNDLSDSAVGQKYPILLDSYDYVPGQWVNTAFLKGIVLLCYGHFDNATVSGANQYIWVDGTSYESASSSHAFSWHHLTDKLGRPYTAVIFSGTNTFEYSEQVYAKLSGGHGTTSPVTQMQYLVEGYTLLCKRGSNKVLFARAEAAVGTLQSKAVVNAAGSTASTTLNFIEGEFLSNFPMISMCWQGGAYGPVVTDHRTDQVSYRLTADQWPILSRATQVTETPKSALYNEFTLHYKYNPQDDNYAAVSQRNASTSALCEMSVNEFGYRPMSPIESLYIHDDATANYVIDWLITHHTLPSYLVDYDVSPKLFFSLFLGDKVLITDAEFGWSEVSATVEGVRWSNGLAVLTLRVWARYTKLGAGAFSGGGGGAIIAQ